VPTDSELVRFLVNDVRLEDVTGNAFSDEEIEGYLAIEGGNVKRAAAQAIDTIADNEVLASKVLKDHQLATDGAKAADALRKRAAALRAQADRDDELSEDGAFFEIVPTNGPTCGPELTGVQYELPGWP
jgi:ssDNA-binding replication factor A large subunit